MRGLEYRHSIRSASAASRTFRPQTRSPLRKSVRASCWVMVLPPCRIPPCRRFAAPARSTAQRSMPPCRKNRRSSAINTASTTVRGKLSSGRHTCARREKPSRTAISSVPAYSRIVGPSATGPTGRGSAQPSTPQRAATIAISPNNAIPQRLWCRRNHILKGVTAPGSACTTMVRTLILPCPLPVQTGGHCVGIRQTLQPIRRNNAQRMVHSTAGTGRMSASRPRATALMRAGSIGFTRKVDTWKRSSNRRMTASSCELTTTIGIPGK